MADDRGEDEPTMDEILTSIRKIIADEDDAAERQSAAKSTKPTDEAEAAGDQSRPQTKPEPLELGPEAMVDQEHAENISDDVGKQNGAAPPGERKFDEAKDNAMEDQQSEDPSTLISNEAAQTSTASFAKITKSAGGKAEKAVPESLNQTVGDLVRELMEPPLKEWLDQNLPGIVERVVEEEVKKLAKRAELQ